MLSRCGLAISIVMTFTGCAIGIGKTGAAWQASHASDTMETRRADDQSGVPEGYERMSFTGRLLTPSNGMGTRFGVNGGFKYGHQLGTYNGVSQDSLAAEGHIDGVIAWSRVAVILTYGTLSMNFDKPEDQLNATQWAARLSYAFGPSFSLNAGASVITDTTFSRDNKPSMIGADGHRLLFGADFFIWQNWFLNFGIKLDASYGSSSAPYMDGTSDTFSGTVVTIEPYLTVF